MKKFMVVAVAALLVALPFLAVTGVGRSEAGAFVGIQAPDIIGNTGEYGVKIWFDPDGDSVNLQQWKISILYPEGLSEVILPAQNPFVYVIAHDRALPVGYQVLFKATAYTDVGEFAQEKIIGVLENYFTYTIRGPKTVKVDEDVGFKFLRKTTCAGGYASVSFLNGVGDTMAAFSGESVDYLLIMNAPSVLAGTWNLRFSVTCMQLSQNGYIHLEMTIRDGFIKIKD